MEEHSSNLMPLLTELSADGECLLHKLVAPNGARTRNRGFSTKSTRVQPPAFMLSRRGQNSFVASLLYVR
jgi:hypothetical protein